MKGWKTIVTAAVAALAKYISDKYGIVIPPDLQVYGLIVVFMALRFFTTTPVFTKES